MRKSILLMLFLCVWRPAAAGFPEGLAAYQQGNYASAYEEWLPLANAGDVSAQRNIGHLLRRGMGIPLDSRNAALWYERAAQAGQVNAQVNLAFMYLAGEGVPLDTSKAAQWFRMAAREGHALANYNLAVMYERGIGVVLDRQRANDLYIQAARLGFRPADARLAQLSMAPPTLIVPRPDHAVLSGIEEVSSDRARERWLTSQFAVGALAADPQALREVLLAGRTAYLQGEFLEAAKQWYLAAEAGDPDAQYGLGQLYMRGQGVDADRTLAYVWLSRAVAGGHAEANTVFQQLLATMQPAEIAEAAAVAAR